MRIAFYILLALFATGVAVTIRAAVFVFEPGVEGGLALVALPIYVIPQAFLGAALAALARLASDRLRTTERRIAYVACAAGVATFLPPWLWLLFL